MKLIQAAPKQVKLTRDQLQPGRVYKTSQGPAGDIFIIAAKYRDNPSLYAIDLVTGSMYYSNSFIHFVEVENAEVRIP